MTRCIQIGTTTIQGPLVAGPYPDPKGEHGAILSRGWRYTGRLVGGALSEGNRPDRLAGKGAGGGDLLALGRAGA